MNAMDAPAPTDKKGPPRFKQRIVRTFKSKAPRPGQKGFGEDIPGMEDLGTGKQTHHKYQTAFMPFFALQKHHFFLFISQIQDLCR